MVKKTGCSGPTRQCLIVVPVEVEIAIEQLKSIPLNYQVEVKLIQAGGETFRSNVYECISICLTLLTSSTSNN
jgi:hypothetical protein